jgi:hypothetical protein
MKRAWRSAFVVLAGAGVFSLGFAVRSSAGPQGGPVGEGHSSEAVFSRPCSAATIRGSFGIKFNGVSGAAEGPVASVTLVTFDGIGSFSGSDVSSFSGTIVRRTLTGTYSVDRDCRGKLVFISHISNPPHESPGDFVVVDGGQEFFIINSEDKVTANGVGKRV